MFMLKFLTPQDVYARQAGGPAKLGFASEDADEGWMEGPSGRAVFPWVQRTRTTSRD